MALDTLRAHCRRLRLPTAAAVVAKTLTIAQCEDWPLETFLAHLLEQELDGRRQRRITRLLKAAHLPAGKTHLAAALGHAWVQRNYTVLFTPTYKLVGALLRTKRDHKLKHELRRLDRFQVVILDDLGYVQQGREEMEVLFTFLAERYERRSVVITSTLVFSQWNQIFKDPLTTVAAIDRVVQHSLIIEFGSDVRSVRAKGAARRNGIVLGNAPASQPAEA